MSTGVKSIDSSDEFKQVINSGKPVLIDFWATWCKPCKDFAPKFEELSNDKGFEGVEFYKVEIDKQEQIAEELRNDLKSIPTFMLFKDGKKEGEVKGAKHVELKELLVRNV